MKIIFSVLGVVAFFAAMPSTAGESYVGASVGIMDIEDDEGMLDFSDNTATAKIYGGYAWNENFAVELGYFRNLTEAEDDVGGLPVEVEIDGFNLRLMGMLPVRDNVSLLGSIGYWDGDAEASVFGISASDSENGVTAGFGVKVDLNPGPVPVWSLRGEFEWYDSDADIWTVLVGVQISF